MVVFAPHPSETVAGGLDSSLSQVPRGDGGTAMPPANGQEASQLVSGA